MVVPAEGVGICIEASPNLTFSSSIVTAALFVYKEESFEVNSRCPDDDVAVSADTPMTTVLNIIVMQSKIANALENFLFMGFLLSQEK